MKLLASLAPNVAVKISGLAMLDWHWTTGSLRPFVLRTVEIFGVDRCMFASNFPVDKLFSSYDDLFNAFKAITKRILGRGAEKALSRQRGAVLPASKH